MLRVLPAIKDLVKEDANLIQVSHVSILMIVCSFESNKNAQVKAILAPTAIPQLSADLELYTELTEAPAKAITCLESSQLSPSDVYIAMLAINASLAEKLKDAPLSDTEKEIIRTKTTMRYDQQINHNTHDVYFTSCVLDPRECTKRSCLLSTDQLTTLLRLSRLCNHQ